MPLTKVLKGKDSKTYHIYKQPAPNEWVLIGTSESRRDAIWRAKMASRVSPELYEVFFIDGKQVDKEREDD
jgi:hypothetical protein|tara:strand:- start:119 stop:331 length:213 start_codon:yes stop_codon:yes gene_type:complete